MFRIFLFKPNWFVRRKIFPGLMAVIALLGLLMWSSEASTANTGPLLAMVHDHKAWVLLALSALIMQSLTIVALVNKDRRASKLAVLLDDAQAHKIRYEESLRQLLALTENSQLLNEREICDQALNIAVSATQSENGYLRFLDDDKNTLSLVTWNAQTLTANHSHYPPDEAGIWADCAKAQTTVIHNENLNVVDNKACPQESTHLLRHMRTTVREGGYGCMIAGVGNKTSDYSEEDSRMLQLVASSVQKIVMRQRGERALAESEDRFRFITDRSPLLVWVADRNDQCTWVNASWLDFTGRTMGKELGQGWFDSIHPEDVEACRLSVASHMATRTPFTVEYRLRRHDGQYRWVLDSGHPRVDTNGVYQGHVGVCLDISERKQAELDLEIFEAFFSLSHDMMAITGKDGYFRQVNQAFCTVLGYSREELMARPFSELLFPADRQATLDEVQRQLQGGVTLNLENRYLCKDGSVRILSWHARADMAREERFSTARDVTELRATQQQLAKVVQAMEQTTQSIVITDINGCIEYVNKAFCDVSGYRPKEVLGLNPRILQSGQTPQSSYTEMWAALQQGDSWKGEFTNRSKQGDTYIEEVRISPVRQSDGHISHYLAIKENITEHKRASQNILQSKILLQKTIDSSPDWIYVKDLQHRFLLVNAPFAKALGTIPDALVGHIDTDFLPLELCLGDPELGVVGLHEYDAAVFTGENIHIAHEKVSLVGDRPREFETFKTPLRDSQLKIFAILSYRRDITERVQTDEQQRSLEKQLQQAQKMELIGHLTGGIAHDFNNILASMLGYTEIMQMSAEMKLHPKFENYLHEILQAGIRAKELVQQLLIFSQKRELVSEAIFVKPIVIEVVKLLQSTLPSSIAIKVGIANDLPQVLVSPVQLHQVLVNLGVNARDAIVQSGTIEFIAESVTLDAEQTCVSCHQTFDDSYLVIVVRDTGAGILPQDLARVFDPFFTTKDVGSGSGLGLSVVHGIVHAAKGHIQVISTPGTGTEFRIYLPCQLASSIQPNHQALQQATANVQLKAHILVVDDEVGIVNMLSTLLQGIGCQVTGLTSATEAQRWFEINSQSVDLVITDLTMPDLSGVDLAHSLLKRRAELPIIMCTGYSDSLSEERAHQIGIRHLLIKPVPARLLLERVAQCLATNTSADQHQLDHS